MLMLIKDLERGEDLGVNTGVRTGVVFGDSSGVLNENMDPFDEGFGEGSPSNSGESLEVVVKLYSGEMLEDDGKDLGDMDDAGDKLYGDGETALELLLDGVGDFKFIRDGEVLLLNSLIAGELQGDMCGDRRW